MTDYPTDVEGLVVTVEPPVLRLRLDRPERRNALTDEVVAALIDALDAVGSDERIRVVALGATGDHFCSGFDLGGRADDGTRPRVGSIQRRLPHHAHRLVPLVLSTQTPVVAAARGWAAGLGLHLLLACDFAVVADGARLWEPFTTLGFTPDSGGTWLVPRLAGVARAKEMLMLGREVSGRDAGEWGLVHRSVPEAEVDATAAALVDELAAAATVSVGLTKWLIHTGLGLDLERHLPNEALAMELSSRSEDFREGGAARRERRPPRFTGR